MKTVLKCWMMAGPKAFLILSGLLLFALPAHADTSELTHSTYTLGPGDEVQINVMNHAEFSGAFPISMEGKIQYTYVGDIDVSGLTKDQLAQKIERIISKYVVSPEVSVTIMGFKSKIFYVLGEVNKPGQYHMQAEHVTLKEALAMAGFPNRAAALRKARIFSSASSGGASRSIDLDDVLYSAGDKGNNVFLNPGDTLYVPAAVEESAKIQKMPDHHIGSTKYTLGPEDVLQINVLDHPEFSGIFPVNWEGNIQYSYLGDIDVTGMTKYQLAEKIKDSLAPYVTSPHVSIRITAFRSKIFYVLGEVRRPGEYRMHTGTITVREALTMAGLPTRFAMQKARIIAHTEAGSTAREVNWYDLLYGGEQNEDAYLKPGDTLYVPAAVLQTATQREGAPNGDFDPLQYTLGPDDVIQISVMYHPEFSGFYTVGMEGKVQYRFVGDIYVTGMSKGQLEERIRDILSVYVSSPQVDVIITQFRSKAIYVLGEVGRPGKYYMRSDKMTVSEAVVMAGLPTEAAAMRKTCIITPGTAQTRKVNLYTLLYKGDVRENLILHPGDYLYVPSTVLAKVIRIFNPVATTIGLATGPVTDVGQSRINVTGAVH